VRRHDELGTLGRLLILFGFEGLTGEIHALVTDEYERACDQLANFVLGFLAEAAT